MTSTKFSSRGFDLSKFISKSILPNDAFALFAREFAKAVPDDADIAQSRGKVSAQVGNRELVLTVVELEKEDGMKIPELIKIYDSGRDIFTYKYAVVWTVCAYENGEMIDVKPGLTNMCMASSYYIEQERYKQYNSKGGYGDRPTSLAVDMIRKAAEAAATWFNPTGWVDIFIEKLPYNAKITSQSDYHVNALVKDGSDSVTIRFEGDRVSLWLTVNYSMSDQVYGRSKPSLSKIEREFDSIEELEDYNLSSDIKRLFSGRFDDQSYGTLGT